MNCFLSIDVNSGSDCLSVTPEKANSDVYSNLENIRKNNPKKTIIAVMKMSFPKMKPSVIRYRKYKIFNNDTFVNTLRQELTKQEEVLDHKGLGASSEICTDVLDKHSTQRKQYLRSNHKPFMNNEISKGIMTRTRLQNRFLKNRSI